MVETEKWKVIPEFDLYEISNKGQVRSKDRIITNGVGTFVKKGRILKPQDNGTGHMRVELKQNGKTRREYIHRLVAFAFLSNPENKPFVNHIDNDPHNNDVSNLEWVTPQENMDWMNVQGRAKRTLKWIEHLHKSQAKTYVPAIGTNIETGEDIYFEKLNDVALQGFNLRVSVIVAKEKGNNTKDIGGNMGNKKRLWSVFTDDMDHCFYTGKSPVERHHIFGASNRKHSEKYGYVIPLSPELHPNGVHANDNARQLDEILKKMAQAHFESHHGTRDDFRKIFGKSYL